MATIVPVTCCTDFMEVVGVGGDLMSLNRDLHMNTESVLVSVRSPSGIDQSRLSGLWLVCRTHWSECNI